MLFRLVRIVLPRVAANHGGEVMPSGSSLAQVLGAAMLFAVAGSCAIATAEELNRIYFAIDNAQYLIDVPALSQIKAEYRTGCTTIWHPRATRRMSFIELCPVNDAARQPRSRHATLSENIKINYDVDYDVGGGMGGTEGELKGMLEIRGNLISLTCHDQDEWNNNPEWCLDYLRSLNLHYGRP
jgi:hypothetical protein